MNVLADEIDSIGRSIVPKVTTAPKKETLYIDIKLVHSPTHFMAYFGKLWDFSSFEKFSKELNKWCNNQVTQRRKQDVEEEDGPLLLQVDQFVCVKYAFEDELLWRRALVNSVHDNNNNNNNSSESTSKVTCYLIDYGFEVELTTSTAQDTLLVDLPPDFSTRLAWIKRCSLKNAQPQLDGDWSAEIIEYFKKLVDEQGLVMSEKHTDREPTSLMDSINCQYSVEIFNKNVSLLKILEQAGYAKMYTPTFITSSEPESQMNSSSFESTSTKIIPGGQKLRSEAFTAVREVGGRGGDGLVADNESSIDIDHSENELTTVRSDDDCIYLTSTFNQTDFEQPQQQQEQQWANSCTTDDNECFIDEAASSSSSSLNTKNNKHPKKIRPSLPGNSTLVNNSRQRNGGRQTSTTSRVDVDDESNEVVNDDDDDDPADIPDSMFEIDNRDYNNRDDNNQRVIRPRQFVCSDETILTGYRPNINVNLSEITAAIREVNQEKNFPTSRAGVFTDKNKQKQFHSNSYGVGNKSGRHSLAGGSANGNVGRAFTFNFHSNRNHSNDYQTQIYEILTGSSGLYDYTDAKVNHLNDVFQKNRHLNGPLIIKSLLNELLNGNLDYKPAFELITKLPFITDTLFDTTFQAFIDENDLFSLHASLTDLKRKSLCILMANLYLIAMEAPEIKCLKQVVKFFKKCIRMWIEPVDRNNELPTKHFVSNLKNIHNFIEICFDTFSRENMQLMLDVKTFARSCSIDITKPNDIRIESSLLLDLFSSMAFEYAKNRGCVHSASGAHGTVTAAAEPLMNVNFNRTSVTSATTPSSLMSAWSSSATSQINWQAAVPRQQQQQQQQQYQRQHQPQPQAWESTRNSAGTFSLSRFGQITNNQVAFGAQDFRLETGFGYKRKSNNNNNNNHF